MDELILGKNRAIPESKIEANTPLWRRAKLDRDKLKNRKSPDTKKLYGLKVGTAYFYFSSKQKRKDFWYGNKEIEGYKARLIKKDGKEVVQEIEDRLLWIDPKL